MYFIKYLNNAGGDSGAYSDNWFRFSLLTQGAILAALQLKLDGRVYCRDDSGANTGFLFHDWHASLLPAYLETARQWGKLYRAASVQVIHNIAHQGMFENSIYKDLMLPREIYPFAEMGGGISYLKTGMVMADHIVTVSPTYAKEITTSQFGMGFESILKARSRRLSGILNGVDIASSGFYPSGEPESSPDCPHAREGSGGA